MRVRVRRVGRAALRVQVVRCILGEALAEERGDETRSARSARGEGGSSPRTWRGASTLSSRAAPRLAAVAPLSVSVSCSLSTTALSKRAHRSACRLPVRLGSRSERLAKLACGRSSHSWSPLPPVRRLAGRPQLVDIIMLAERTHEPEEGGRAHPPRASSSARASPRALRCSSRSRSRSTGRQSASVLL